MRCSTKSGGRGALMAFFLAAQTLVVAAVAAEPGKSADGRTRRVLFIGIDGCRFDAVQAADAPNLKSLMADGCYDADTQILGERYQKNDTISGPGWSSILTSVWADKHGVHDNSFKGKNYKEFPHVFARLKEVQPEARTISITTWLPIQLHIVSAADEAVPVAPVDNDYVPADAKAALAAVKILTEQDPTLMFYYIGQVDETGHKHGFHPSVSEYVAAIHQADLHVGQVLAALRARPKYAQEEWLVLVTSDHGGKGTSHSNGHEVPEIRNSFMIASGPAAKRGPLDETTYLVDVPATALAYLGVSPKAEWQLDGRAIGLK